uniref:Uncharacterized protein n=1 Tax=uncultured bacterium Contig1777 TaxID=1393514 RepID=W0FVU2_9BACT|nr:hypothetical protein [uncultured bacterium Contig1777]
MYITKSPKGRKKSDGNPKENKVLRDLLAIIENEDVVLRGSLFVAVLSAGVTSGMQERFHNGVFRGEGALPIPGRLKRYRHDVCDPISGTAELFPLAREPRRGWSWILLTTAYDAPVDIS